MTRPPALESWHAIVAGRTPESLADLLADDVVFRSPAVHTPQEGKAVTTAYLTVAIDVLGPTLTYRREWSDDQSAVLEFTAQLDGRDVHGIDMLTWNEHHQLVEFTVMVRPFQGLQALIARMSAALQLDRS